MSSAFIQIFAMGLSHLFLVLLRQRSKWLGRLLDGTPLLLISGGRWHEETMRHMLVEQDDVLTAVRDKGTRLYQGSRVRHTRAQRRDHDRRLSVENPNKD